MFQLKEEKDATNEARSGSSSSVAVGGADSRPSSTSGATPGLSRSESEPSKCPERKAGRYEAPKRDEEAETNRKIKAKRARETRRSTQVCMQRVLPGYASLSYRDCHSYG